MSDRDGDGAADQRLSFMGRWRHGALSGQNSNTECIFGKQSSILSVALLLARYRPR